jgi:SEL1 protein
MASAGGRRCAAGTLVRRLALAALAAGAGAGAVDEGWAPVGAALALRSVAQVKAALEAVAGDAAQPATVRGAALTELALAHENVYPSFGTRDGFVLAATTNSKALVSNVLGGSGAGGGSAGSNSEGWVGDREGSFTSTAVRNALLDRGMAVELFQRAAELGNATAQFRLGTLFATGALGVEKSAVKAALHYYFASLGGSVEASMALGFRHSVGLGVPKDCRAAVAYYELAANAVADQTERDGVSPVNDRDRLTLDRKTRGYTGRSSRGMDEEVVDYYKHAAEKGDVSATLMLGQVYFYGARGVARDHRRALEFFRAAAAQGDPAAQAHLGHMLIKGMGGRQDVVGALGNLTAAAEAGSASGLNGLGYLHLYGLGVKADPDKARKYFNDAAEAGNAEAYYNLGALYVSGVGVRRRNYPHALNYFSMAAQKGHYLAMHKLAQMNLHGVGTLKNCEHALQLFKAVAERGESVRLLARGFSFWNNEDDVDSALQVYLLASELGFEVAQANAAWLLDHGASMSGGVRSVQPRPALAHATAQSAGAVGADAGPGVGTGAGAGAGAEGPAGAGAGVAAGGGAGAAVAAAAAQGSSSHTADVHESDDLIIGYVNAMHEVAVAALIPTVAGSLDSLRLYQLAAEQGNVEARIKIGDFFYYGLGGSSPNFELAAHHYKQASDLGHSPQAMFNLGFMHQYGIGLPQDFHLAKRFYDSAEATHPDAKVPVSLALSGMWMQRVYRAIVFKELTKDLPPFVATLASWYDLLFTREGAGPAADTAGAGPAAAVAPGAAAAAVAAAEGAAPAAPPAAGKPLVDQLVDAASDLEDDTVVAICLFALMVLVLLMRAREQRRFAEQIAHEHQE